MGVGDSAFQSQQQHHIHEGMVKPCVLVQATEVRERGPAADHARYVKIEEGLREDGRVEGVQKGEHKAQNQHSGTAHRITKAHNGEVCGGSRR